MWGSHFAIAGRKPGAQRTGGQRWRSGGASPGPGGSLVGEPTSFDGQAGARRATSPAKARWGQSPASRPDRGRARCFCCAVRRRPSTARSRDLQGRVPKTPCPPAKRSPKGRPEAAGGAPSYPQGNAGVRHAVRTRRQTRQGVLLAKRPSPAQCSRRSKHERQRSCWLFQLGTKLE